MRRIIILLVVSYWLLVTGIFAMDIDLWSLPRLPESEVIWQDKNLEVNGIVAPAMHLRSKLSTQEIIDFYKDILTKYNWQINEHYPKEHVLIFTQQDKFFYVVAMENGKDLPCDVYLVNSPADLAICKTLKDYFLQETVAPDTQGKDFSDLPRYPGSKRRLNVFTPFEGAALIYEAQAQPQEIAQFYRQNLKASGWKEERALTQEMFKKLARQLKGIELPAILLFYRGKDSLLINVTSVPKLSGRSLIIIAKNIEKEMIYPKKTGDK